MEKGVNRITSKRILIKIHENDTITTEILCLYFIYPPF